MSLSISFRVAAARKSAEADRQLPGVAFEVLQFRVAARVGISDRRATDASGVVVWFLVCTVKFVEVDTRPDVRGRGGDRGKFVTAAVVGVPPRIMG